MVFSSLRAIEGMAEDPAKPDSPVNVIHLPVKLKVRGSGPGRVLSVGRHADAVAGADFDALSSKSNTSKLLAIRRGFTDWRSGYYAAGYAC
jgi:hypothetical protein